VFLDSDRVCVECPESENSERPAVEERESPGVREIELPGRAVSTRSELETDEHPESALREFRRTLRESERQENRSSLRKRVRVHPGREKKGLQKFWRTLRQNERTHLERETRHSQRRTETHPDAVAMALVGGAKIPEKRILPAIPMHAGDFEELIKDLKTIGCSGLFGRVWDVQDADMLAEIGGGAMEDAFRTTIRAKFGNWTREHWRETYNFPDREEDLEAGGKGDTEWVKDRFTYLSDHDGFKVTDCVNPREQRLLEYVVPILNPEKPTTLTVTLAREILSALHRRKKINWAYLVHRNIQKMARTMGSKKGCALAPFLYHLYEKNGCITSTERKRLETPLFRGNRAQPNGRQHIR
jgi:hypothetical protein